MTSVMNIALGGLQRNARGVQVVAENVANVNTDGFRARRYDPGSDSVTLSNDTPPDAAGPDQQALPPSDVDLATELVNLKKFEIGYRASGVVFSAADRMTGELLNMFA